MKQGKYNNGFTLIEVMIVVAIIAIIAAIAVPSYRHHVGQVNRKAAITKMLEVGQTLERQYNTIVKGAYPNNYPVTTLEGYNITVNTGGQSYTITAATKSGEVYDDKCGALTIDNSNVRTANGGTTLVSKCFK